MSYSEMHHALTGLYLKGNNGTHYGFLKRTTLQDHFVSPFCNSNMRNKRNDKMVLCFCTLSAWYMSFNGICFEFCQE